MSTNRLNYSTYANEVSREDRIRLNVTAERLAEYGMALEAYESNPCFASLAELHTAASYVFLKRFVKAEVLEDLKANLARSRRLAAAEGKTSSYMF